VKPLAFAFLAGLASACGFEPLGLWPLSLAAFALLLWLVRSAPGLRGALARGWWFGVGHFVLGLNWIATAFTYQAEMPAWLGWIAVVLLSLYLAVYPAVAAGLAWRWARGDGLRLALVFAAAWIVTEWLRASLFTGFAWNPLGVALLPTPVSSLATTFGTYGLSGIVALLAGVLLLLSRRAWRPAAALAGSIAVATGISPAVSQSPPQTAGIPLRIIQPNIGQQDKWREDFIEENEARLAGMSRRGEGRPRLLLWPEAAVTRPLQNELAYPRLQQEAAMELRQQVAETLGDKDMLLTGGITWRSPDGLDVTSATNSVFAIDRSGRILGRYDKAHLVPYGEYLPMRPILSALGLSRLAPGALDFDPGPRPADDRPAGHRQGRLPALLRDRLLGQGRRPEEPARFPVQPLERRLVRRLGAAAASRPGPASRPRRGAAGAALDPDRNLRVIDARGSPQPAWRRGRRDRCSRRRAPPTCSPVGNILR
jgi:apolipoprotein N-acyltransferase